ncbi:hypothetical protein IV55_GL000706 [Furfurilactobacillus siliginis]|uniref:Uncharacterized protein n=1 Tax=Furfurilactobacillus siliginis TaxID=348151 RepID=A0A0R2LB07_9LACO|nr:hypothetical protein IV55_GL000706 [Furfurilactobacillus siliginis]
MPDEMPDFIARQIDYLQGERQLDLFSSLIYLMSWKRNTWIHDEDHQEMFAIAWLYGYERV